MNIQFIWALRIVSREARKKDDLKNLNMDINIVLQENYTVRRIFKCYLNIL